jgi:branched-chain amino acid transport system substrate-binding protein
MKLRTLSVLAAAASIVFAACSGGPGASGGGGGGRTVWIGIDLPQQGSELAGAEPVINGIQLAIKDAGGKAGPYTVESPKSVILDDAKDGKHDPQTGAQNMTTLVGNDQVVAVIGPLNSNVAKVQIPISNEAGLLQCSPANTNEGLTKPEFGAKDVRSKFPDRINYVRVVTTDDKQGPAAAKYILEVLKKTKVYIIDDTETFGKGIADNFQKYLTDNGGTVVARDGIPSTVTDYGPYLTAAKAKGPEAIYFGGVTASGGARILKAAVQAGLGDIPFIGPDGIYDGGADTKDSFLNLAGDDAKNAFATAAAVGDYPGKADFDAKYKAAYGKDPTGYSATGYACAQVILNALGRAGDTPDNKTLREKLRAAAVDPSVKYQSVIGEFNFDQNGDTSQLIISFYGYDPATKNWAFKSQLDFAKPAA